MIINKLEHRKTRVTTNKEKIRDQKGKLGLWREKARRDSKENIERERFHCRRLSNSTN